MGKPDVSNFNREDAQMQASREESSPATFSSHDAFHVIANDRLLTQREALAHLPRRVLTRLVAKGLIRTVPSHGDSGRILYLRSDVLAQAEAWAKLNRPWVEFAGRGALARLVGNYKAAARPRTSFRVARQR
jgi:hypothetical protein